MNSGLLKYWEHIGYLHDDGKPHNGDIPRWVRSAFYKSKYQELTFRGRTFEYLIVKGSPSNYDVYRRRRKYNKKKLTRPIKPCKNKGGFSYFQMIISKCTDCLS